MRSSCINLFSSFYHFVCDNGSKTLNFLQKKITSFSLAIFALASDCFNCTKNYFTNRKVEVLHPDSAKPDNNKGNNLNNDEQLTDDLRLQIIKDKLDKNLHLAISQKTSGSHNFQINLDAIPEVFEVKGNIYQYPFNIQDIDAEEKTINATGVGAACCIGLRDQMEDTHLITNDTLTLPGKQPQVLKFFGVFDGHSGADASKYVQEKIVKYIIDELSKKSVDKNSLSEVEIWDALKSSFKKIDNDYLGEDGTTAIIGMVLEDNLWIANVGDSRAVFVSTKGDIAQVSEDAKPTIERYKKTILKLGGDVVFGRVHGLLAVARAIGDKDIIGDKGKCCISPSPKITRISLKDQKGSYLVLACDGLYDVASSNEVGDSINKMNALQLKPMEMAKRMVYSALKNGSQDNITVLVIQF